jgi:hypothetical protein
MAGGTSVRTRRIAVVVGLATVLGAGATGTAAAAPADLTPGHGQVTPLVDCVRPDGTGALTAVLGYANSGTATEHLFGPANHLQPAPYDGTQPTKFASGTHHGVLSVRIPAGQVSWTLDGTTVVADAGSPACPPADELPADGNGTGPVIALLLAALIGALVLARVGRSNPTTPHLGA